MEDGVFRPYIDHHVIGNAVPSNILATSSSSGLFRWFQALPTSVYYLLFDVLIGYPTQNTTQLSNT